MSNVGLVIVSHSEKIAEGTRDLALQMAADVTILAAGGLDDGGIGTSYDKIEAAVNEVTGPVAILCDLGSAVLTSETVVEFLDDDRQQEVKIADAPVVEGAIAAAVAAQTGGTLAQVLAAAHSAYSASDAQDESATSADNAPADADPDANADAVVSQDVTVIAKAGLHARPVAQIVKLAAELDTDVTINGVDSNSLLQIMGLGVKPGDTVTVAASGEHAADAVARMSELVGSDFGE